jgi:hypothetical protein
MQPRTGFLVSIDRAHSRAIQRVNGYSGEDKSRRIGSSARLQLRLRVMGLNFRFMRSDFHLLRKPTRAEIQTPRATIFPAPSFST